MIDESHHAPNAEDPAPQSEVPAAAPDPSVAEPGAAARQERRPLLARPLLKFTFLLLAAVFVWVLLGLLISPRYWRF